MRRVSVLYAFEWLELGTFFGLLSEEGGRRPARHFLWWLSY